MKIGQDGSWEFGQEWTGQTKEEERAGWTTEWVKQRVKLGNHRILTRYLVQRSAEQAAELAGIPGLTVPEILRRAFLVKNGQIAVPDDAMKVLRNVDGAHPADVWAIVSASTANEPESLSKRLTTFRRAVLAWAKRTGGDPRPWTDLVTVHEVMRS